MKIANKKRAASFKRRPLTAKGLLNSYGERRGTSDVCIAAVNRSDSNGIGPGRSPAGGTPAATQPRANAQEDQHRQCHRPSLSSDTRDQQQQQATGDRSSCRGNPGLVDFTRRALLETSRSRDGRDRDRRASGAT
jgi:hypothetical protein